MPTIDLEVIATDTKYRTVKWPSLEDGDDGKVADVGQYPDRSLQITGTLGGAVPSLEGSMDRVTWFQLTSDGVTAIGALGMFWVWENPKFTRPKNVGGDGTTDVTYQLGMSTLV
ncbi:MAG: hypothetical protein IIB87_04555 [Chloroflexi bacterium]|nr:hypothetical protein [Chloroflexota bacterium]